jgi:hypothetical protein
MAILTSFIHETLELNGISVILLNHVIEEKADGKTTGNFISFGSGKFLEKGGFYSTVNESVTLATELKHRIVYMREEAKQARTAIIDLPDKMYVANTVDPSKSKSLKEGEGYFSLKAHIDLLLSQQTDLAEWSF